MKPTAAPCCHLPKPRRWRTARRRRRGGTPDTNRCRCAGRPRAVAENEPQDRIQGRADLTHAFCQRWDPRLDRLTLRQLEKWRRRAVRRPRGNGRSRTPAGPGRAGGERSRGCARTRRARLPARWRCRVSPPLKSLGSTSMPASGTASRTRRTVSAHIAAPPSGRSSRATPVSTTNLRPIRATASAIRAGSSRSTGSGLAVITSQKPHRRVASIAEDQERGLTVLPTLVDVGAHRLLADSAQVEATHQVLELGRVRDPCAAAPRPWRLPLAPGVHVGARLTGRHRDDRRVEASVAGIVFALRHVLQCSPVSRVILGRTGCAVEQKEIDERRSRAGPARVRVP